jgi:uncharacterized repeat protein (TIGR02543 family)
MKRKYLILLTLVAITLTLLLSGCGRGGQSIEGMYGVTFEVNGGKLNIGTTSTEQLKYAYDPGSYMIDPATFRNYKISRPGYIFTGWYTSADCKENERWDFATQPLNVEALTLYAGWEKEIVYTYTVCYADGENIETLGNYSVMAGEKFEDYRKHANKREGYTPTGYFVDAACQTPWDFETVHPGGDVDTDVCVYVDYIEGEWKLVDSYETLLAAINEGNVYLTADIDCGGQELYFSGTYTRIFQGNRHKISNFTVKKSGGALIPSCTLFQSIAKGAEIRNVSFENATFMLMDVDSRVNKVRVAAIARDASGGIVSDVSITGKLVTNYEGELPNPNQAFYEVKDAVDITGFTANITVEKNS